MRLFYLILIVPTIILMSNCNTSKKSNATKVDTVKTEQTTVKSPDTVKIEQTATKSSEPAMPKEIMYRFTVSFISKGAGTDYQIKQKYDAFIADFEFRNKVQIITNKASWGREGEVDYCFDLKDLNSTMTDSFIAESKALLSASTLINIGENTRCRGEVK